RHGKAKAPAPERGQRGKGGQRIRDGEEAPGGACRKRCDAIRSDNGSRRAALEGLSDEVVAIEVLAFERDEEIAPVKRSRVGRYVLEADVRPRERSTDRASRRRRIHHRPLQRRRARAA